jgi:hypothetical protein
MQKGGPSTGRRSRWSAYPTKLLLVEHVVVDTLVSASYLLATIACVVGKCLHQALFLALVGIEERCVEERQ